MKRKPSKAAQRRAVARQVSAPEQPAATTIHWLCGGCGTVMHVPKVSCAFHRDGGAWSGGVLLAVAVACPEPACDARLVRCVRCGGEKAARAALMTHACRAVAT